MVCDLSCPILSSSPHKISFPSHLSLNNLCSWYRVVNPQTDHHCSHKEGWNIYRGPFAQVSKNVILVYVWIVLENAAKHSIIQTPFEAYIYSVCELQERCSSLSDFKAHLRMIYTIRNISASTQTVFDMWKISAGTVYIIHSVNVTSSLHSIMVSLGEVFDVSETVLIEMETLHLVWIILYVLKQQNHWLI